MQEQKKPETGNSILAISGGIVAAAATGFILYPLEMVVFDEFFELNFGKSSGYLTTNDLILNASFILWFSIAAWAGGCVCSLIAKGKERHHILVIFGISLIFFIRGYIEVDRLADFIVVTIMMVAVYLALLFGCHTGIKMKTRRNAKRMIKEDN